MTAMKITIAFVGLGLSACMSATVEEVPPPNIYFGVSAQHDKMLVTSSGETVTSEGYQPSYGYGEVPPAVTMPVTIDGVPVVIPFPCSAQVGAALVTFHAIDVVDDSTLAGVMSFQCYEADGAAYSGDSDETIKVDRKHLPPILKGYEPYDGY